MDNLKISVEVSLSETTLKALAALIGALPAQQQPRPVEETAKVAAQTPTPAPKPEPEDLPISDEEMLESTRLCVAALKAKGKDPKVIKEIFKKYGCANSTGCPADKRAALIKELETLKDNA